jgi:hypothetical protein
MKWWQYRLARGAGYGIGDTLAAVFFGKELDWEKRKAEIAAQRVAIFQGAEERGDWEGADKLVQLSGCCRGCGYELRPGHGHISYCDECRNKIAEELCGD